jgi:hypothetical protein
VSDLIADLVRKFFEFFSGSLSLGAHVVEMLVEMSPGFFASFARRSSMRRRRPNGDLLFLRETPAEELL